MSPFEQPCRPLDMPALSRATCHQMNKFTVKEILPSAVQNCHQLYQPAISCTNVPSAVPTCHQQYKPAQSAFSGLRALPSALSVCPQHSACPQHCCSAFSCHCSQLLCLSLPPLTELCSFQTKIMGTTSSSGAQSCPKTRLRPNKASARFKGQYHSGGRLAGPRAGPRLPPPPSLPSPPPLSLHCLLAPQHASLPPA